VSALAHWLEDEGIATSLIALVRPHAERMRPPRSLWVPFELGRPMGPPGDAAFQRRVLQAALALLTHATQPGVIVDFEEDDPDAAGDASWRPPALPARATVADEVAALRPLHERACARYGRTSVGLTELDAAVIADFLTAYADDEATPRPRTGLSPASLMRFGADDLKAYYLEAAGAAPGSPSSAQLCDWFWGSTAAAALLQRIRLESPASGDRQRQALAEKSLVPGLYAGATTAGCSAQVAT
jgi:hypothetical protein